MAADRFNFSGEKAFIRLERQRLGRGKDLLPWGGAWASALEAELKKCRLLDDDPPYAQADVVNCFCDLPRPRLEELFFALRKACEISPPADQTSIQWATELSCLAAARTLDMAQWSEIQCQAGNLESPNALAAQVATSSNLVAAVALSRLMGFNLHWNLPSAPDSLIDLTETFRKSAVTDQAVLTAIADELARYFGQPQSLDPARTLNQDELAALRDTFDSFRLEKKLLGVYVQLDTCLTPDMVMDILGRVASELNSAAVGGAAQHEKGWVHPDSKMSLPLLKVKLEKIFQQFAGAASTGATEAAPMYRSTPDNSGLTEVFVSHASEDKTHFVDGLVRALKSAGIRVWYDNDQIQPGDSISGKIRQGMRESRFALVILSRDYLTKGKWVDAELNALLSEEFSSGVKRVIPVRWNVSVEEVRKVWLDVGDKLAIDGSLPLDQVVSQIANVLRPQR